ncbi:MAG: DUF1854 domain-containing protein [Rhodothermales bacterium]
MRETATPSTATLSTATPLTLVEASRLEMLDPARLTFFRHGAALRLTVAGDRSYLSVAVLRAFPLSEPARFLSLRDGEGKEIGVLAEPAALGEADRLIVEDALERRYFVPEVTRILAAKERFGTVDWTVQTNRGERRFTTQNLRENSTRPAPGRLILSDIDGNRYDIRDIDGLDRESQTLLYKHV